MKITKSHMDSLIKNIEDKKASGEVVVSFDGIEGLLDAMGIEDGMKNYIDKEDFIDAVREHKLLAWHKLSFLIKDNKVHFFSYIERRDTCNK